MHFIEFRLFEIFLLYSSTVYKHSKKVFFLLFRLLNIVVYCKKAWSIRFELSLYDVHVYSRVMDDSKPITNYQWSRKSMFFKCYCYSNAVNAVELMILQLFLSTCKNRLYWRSTQGREEKLQTVHLFSSVCFSLCKVIYKTSEKPIHKHCPSHKENRFIKKEKDFIFKY